MRRILSLLAVAGLFAGATWLALGGRRTEAPLAEPASPVAARGAPGAATRPSAPRPGDAKPRDLGAVVARASRPDAAPVTLLAAALVTKDEAWLRRAADLHPGDPDVLIALVRAARTPEERVAALAAFRAADPDNAMGYYLTAADAAKAGDPTAAAAALVDASTAEELRRGEVRLLLETDALLREAGAGDLEAHIIAVGLVPAWSGAELLRLGKGLGDLQRIFVELGDWDEADFLLEQTLRLGGSLRQGGLLLDNLGGAHMETGLLSALDPETVIAWDGERAGERLADLEKERAEIAGLAGDTERLMGRFQGLDAAGWAEYRRRLAGEGERAALRWLLDR